MKISKKFILANVIMSILLATVLIVIISLALKDNFGVSIENRLANQNNSLSKLASNGFVSLENESGEAKYNNDVANIVYKKNSKGEYDVINMHASSFSQISVDDTLEKEAETVFKVNVDGNGYYAYYTVSEHADVEYVILSLMPTEEVTSLMLEILKVYIMAVIVLVFISFMYNNIISKMITKPIKNILEGISRIGAHDFDTKIEIDKDDEFKEIANAINLMSANLKNQDVEQKKLYQTISHEIKTPLTVIRCSLEGIEMGLFDNLEDTIEIAIAETEKIKSLVDNTIYLNKLDTIENFYKIEVINLAEILGEALNSFKNVFTIQNIKVNFECSSSIYVEADKEKFLRALTNILSNSIKYTNTYINIRANIENGYVYLTIDDDGKGFADDFLRNPYTATLIGEKAGTGIGMKIIFKIVTYHKWEFYFSNKIEGGAQYLLKIKIKSEK